jgi:hypothetical protein
MGGFIPVHRCWVANCFDAVRRTEKCVAVSHSSQMLQHSA